jgi:hypothetical protein
VSDLGVRPFLVWQTPPRLGQTITQTRQYMGAYRVIWRRLHVQREVQSRPAGGPPAIPVYPPYPYKAGHYPTADAYYDLPPYAAINPSFYRWRFFLTAQERNRYRYMPHIFRGYTGYPEDTVSSSYVSSSQLESKPMSPKPPTKTEPGPAAPSGVLEPNVKKEDTGSAPGPAGTPSPQAPEAAPSAPSPGQ